jgi:hypothetical protein
MTSRLSIAAAFLITVSLVNLPARADSSAIPGDYVARPLTLPKSTLRIDSGPKWPFPPYRTGQLTVTHVDLGLADDTWVHLNPGATFGIVRDFELGFMLPMRLSPEGDLEDPVVHLMYRFADGDAEAGFFVAAPLPFDGPFHPITGIPIRLHLGNVIAFDLGPFVRIDLEDTGDDGDEEGVDLILPFELSIQASDAIHFGPELTVELPEFDGVNIPVGFFLGYTITDASGTLGDLVGRTRLYTLDDGIDVWQLMLSFDLFFDF